MSRTPFHEPWIEVSLDNLLHNLGQIRSRLSPGCGVIAVVKDSAYGCGAGPVSALLERNGVNLFAVARASEARFLRNDGLRATILILGRVSSDDLAWGAENNIQFTLDSIATLTEWNQVGIPVSFHLEIDTGMTRTGIAADEITAFTKTMATANNLDCAGAFTHLACADAATTDSAEKQLALFDKAMVELRQNGISPRQIHTANSAASIRFANRFNLVRPGIALYGCNPGPGQNFGLNLKPVAFLKAPVARVRAVPAGTVVSYGSTYTTTAETTIATIGIGYGQGVPRYLSNRGGVLINGKRYPIAGRVTMDYIMADIGPETGIIPGDEAVILGSQGGETITADDIALLGNTIGYEVLCNLGRGVHRYYFLDGQPLTHQHPGLI